eukprot:12342068-Karenia_brevis.AAC.1
MKKQVGGITCFDVVSFNAAISPSGSGLLLMWSASTQPSQRAVKAVSELYHLLWRDQLQLSHLSVRAKQ